MARGSPWKVLPTGCGLRPGDLIVMYLLTGEHKLGCGGHTVCGRNTFRVKRIFSTCTLVGKLNYNTFVHFQVQVPQGGFLDY
jgi:hypothetical protein